MNTLCIIVKVLHYSSMLLQVEGFGALMYTFSFKVDVLLFLSSQCYG